MHGSTSLAGLTTSEAEARLRRDGPNELPRRRGRTALTIIGEVLREPMLAMLLGAGLIYLLLGDRTEALILLVFACASVGLTVFQQARTENVLRALQDLAAPRALVVRDGSAIRVAGREVVEGDVLILAQGDRIAADALVLEGQELELDESLLTGESLPVGKQAQPTSECDETTRVYSGSLITRGEGLGLVVATGSRSRIGQIGHSIQQLEPEAPRLQRETGRIVRLAGLAAAIAALLVVLLYGFSRGGWLDATLAGIAAGMSLLPEEFPVVLSVFLAVGAWRIAKVGVLTRRTAAIETLGAATVLCTDKTGTLTLNRMTVQELWLPSGDTVAVTGACGAAAAKLLATAAMASAPVPADPMEVATHDAAALTEWRPSDDVRLVHSHGLRPDLLAMSNLWQGDQADRTVEVSAKGAPEAIAELCRLDGMGRERMTAAALRLAERGFRVLGVASAVASEDDIHKDHRVHRFDFVGLIGLVDPLRPEVPAAIAECVTAGIRIVMITGDFPTTARAIADAAGIGGAGLMTGAEVACVSDADLIERVRGVTVFARTMPEQKLRIVNALKAAGEVVAMTGDGVNDAPALKAAHIGIAMGKRGTDAAREASAMVLVEDDFAAIVHTVRVGRRIYDNMRKALAFIIAVHVPIAGLALLPLMLGMPIILGPIQIALLEMIIDPVCALVFEAEREEERLMQRPPRSPAESLLTKSIVARSLLEGGAVFFGLAALLVGAGELGMPADELRTLIFFALVGMVLALIFANRAFSTSLRVALTQTNRVLVAVVAVIAGIASLILSLRPLQEVMQFSSLSGLQLLLIAGLAVLMLLVLEQLKRRVRLDSPRA